LQSVPKIAYGPTKKKIVPPKNNKKNTATPIEYNPKRHVPLPYLLDVPFIEPVNPATPKSKKIMDEI